jgi:hypothetical protein
MKVEAVKAWGVERKCKHPYLVAISVTGEFASLLRPNNCGQEIESKPLRVRVMRERDFKRLLKAAKGNL